MKFTYEKQSDVIVIKANGSLDVSIQNSLKEKLSEIIIKGDHDLVFDFSEINFIDSSCLGLLVSFAKQLRDKKGDLKLSQLSEDVQSIFQITRLDRVFCLFSTNQEAIDDFYR